MDIVDIFESWTDLNGTLKQRVPIYDTRIRPLMTETDGCSQRIELLTQLTSQLISCHSTFCNVPTIS